MNFGLIGSSVEKSFSKQIHESISGIDYSLLSLKTDDEFLKFLKQKEFKGINVTIPYKSLAVLNCDVLSKDAETTNVVNTILNREGQLFGYNTDAFGFEYLLKHNNVNIQGKSCGVMGTGATSRTVGFVLNKLGAKEIIFFSRNPSKSMHSYNDQEILKNLEIIVNTTPKEDDILIKSDTCEKLEIYIDVLYKQEITKQGREFRKKNIKTINGLRMLVAQALKSDEIFLNKSIDDSLIEDTYKNVFIKERNIVLIGHPLAGKTTIAKSLAKSLQMKFVDTDLLIEEKYQMTISEIFKEFGEETFRKVESEIIEELKNKKGLVISSGGGIVLNRANIDCLRSNSLVINLTRDISESNLNELAVRPLLKSIEKLIETIKVRQKLYEQYADYTIENKDVSSTIEKIRRTL